METEDMRTSKKHRGFPKAYTSYLRCGADAGELAVQILQEKITGFIINGKLTCKICGSIYSIVDGIVRLIMSDDLKGEDLHEMQIRDKEAEERPEFSSSPRADLWHRLEMDPTISSLEPYQGKSLLELACGTGRYTTKFVGKCRTLIAVYFSLASLQALAGKIPSGSQIGLVQADITKLAVAPRSFDRVFSTTSLDNRDQRMIMNRLAADALVDGGKYVYSTEFNDLRTRLLGLPRARRYSDGGNYYCHLNKDEVLRETAPYFRRIRTRPIRIYLPFTDRLGNRPKYAISRVAEQVPLIRDLGELLLVSAELPIRPPIEGESTGGSKVVKAIYCWYKGEYKTTRH